MKAMLVAIILLHQMEGQSPNTQAPAIEVVRQEFPDKASCERAKTVLVGAYNAQYYNLGRNKRPFINAFCADLF